MPLPLSLKKTLARVAVKVPGNRLYRTRHWMETEYSAFALANMRYVFLSIARFAHINRPIDGYYMEFGSHEARTMRLAWRHFQHMFNWDFIAFDSFQGLPEIEGIDKQEIWKKGKLETGEQDFIRIVTEAGMPRQRLRTVKGFFDDSLTPELQQQLLPRKAAVIYVDCDLYKSTIPVLKFIKPFLQTGTIIVFDDWNCFYGDPERGERRAWREFREAHPELRFTEFVSTNEAQSFIHLGALTHDQQA
jgi:O-methyltransferase